MKVSEAKEKVCPFIQQIYVGRPNITMDGKATNIHCICGDCMAWVFTKASVSYKNGEVEYHCDFAGKELSNNEKEGYCARIGQ